MDLAELIYSNWTDKTWENRNTYFESGKKLLDRLDGILCQDLCEELYETFVDSCCEVEKAAFIDGFNYAVKCLSAGKIELSKGGR